MDVTIACICPKKEHPDGDTVSLRDRLDFRSANTILKAIQLMQSDDEEVETAEVLALLTEQYLLYGIESWTLVSDSGPLPVTKAAIREVLLPSPDAMTVGDAADELYAEQVMLPLVARAARLSRPSPTDGSTSPKTDDSESPTPTTSAEHSTSSSSQTPRKPSKPSSITTIPTVDTATTTSSLDGDSNSSQSSTSAA
jgi:hypothetical protein